jgi:LPXTG-motif cell wall-anchored protein
MVAPTPDVTTTYPQDATVSGPGTGNPSDTGTVTVEAVEIPAVGSWPVAMGMTALGSGGLALTRRRRQSAPIA